MSISPELADYRHIIQDAARDYGLDPFRVVFEVLDYRQLNEVAAYGGFPTRYPHWRHGMNFERVDKEYRYGLSKIYELVINNDPCYAYLLSSNSLTDNKLVMAHVYGHSDFFKHNIWFARTDRRMMDRMANHATRVRKLVDRYGRDEVEGFLDRALSLENLVDLQELLVGKVRCQGDDEENPPLVRKLPSRSYMDPYVNPREFMERQRDKLEQEAHRLKKVPVEPVRDVMGFLLEHAPLDKRECELLNIVREEALYFAPQRCTKIMNEGWASFWHQRIMTRRVLTDEEVVDYADTMAGTLAGGGGLNPYKLGMELFLDIEERWNAGRHGLDYERCDEMEERNSWDTGAGEGLARVFFVRKVYNDVTFVDEFLTEEFCHRNKLFVYEWNPRSGRREIVTRDFKKVKEQLLRQLANGGTPLIEVADANHDNRGELYLVHRWDGMDLRPDYAQATLRHVQSIWKRPAYLETRLEGRRQVFFTDGEHDKVQDLGEEAGEAPA